MQYIANQMTKPLVSGISTCPKIENRRGLLRNPSPSFPDAPPKRFVNTMLFWFARQKIETPSRTGNMYWRYELSFALPGGHRGDQAYLGHNFPEKQDEENNIKYLHLGFRLALVAVERFEQTTNRQSHRPEHLGRAHNDIPEQTSDAVTDELRGQCNEDTCSVTRIATVEKLLGSQCLGSECRLGSR